MNVSVRWGCLQVSGQLALRLAIQFSIPLFDESKWYSHLENGTGIHSLFFSLASWAHGHTVTHSISAKASFGRLWRCAQRAWANGSEWQSCAVWAIHVGIYFGQAGGVVSPYMNLGFKPAFVGFLNGQMRPKSKSANSIGLEIQFLELLLLCMGH